jgi:Domain of unknown function (DUF1929)/Bacterial Ig domain/Fibronectin type III domain
MGFITVGSIGFGSLFKLFKNQSSSLIDSSNDYFYPQTAVAQTTGSWSIPYSTTAVPIHAALTYTGKIFYFAGSGNCPDTEHGPFLAKVLDPATGSETNVPLNEDLFCAGAVQLAAGNIFICGGTLLYDTDVNNCSGTWHGANYAYEFDVPSNTLVKRANMKQGRWYPTVVTLADGRVVVVSGVDELGSYNYLTEIYDPNSKSWSIKYDPSTSNTYCVGSDSPACPGAGSPCYGGPNQGTAPWLNLYPRMHLMPSGLVFQCGQMADANLLDPSTGTWTHVNTTSQVRSYGTLILLPLQNTNTERGKVMNVGGAISDTDPATTVVEIEDFNAGSSTNPVLRSVPSLNFARRFILPIILPNGKIAVFGGSSQGGNSPVLTPEIFDPENEGQGWKTLPQAQVARMYHGVALLLPDGSIWTASTTATQCVPELRTEIFKPDYFSATRPTISGAPTVGGYGQSITIPSPDAANINRVSLVRLGATTHHYDTNVRLIWLQITSRGSNSITVSAPLNANLAPPGYYMIHVLNQSLVPSTAQIIKIPGTASGSPPPPAQVIGLTVAPASSTTQLSLSWAANPAGDNVAHYNVYRSTTSGFTPGSGNLINSTVTATSFQDSGLTADTTYYYVISATNSAGEGPVSAQASGTTLAATATPTVKITSPSNGASVPLGNVLVQGTAAPAAGGSGILNVTVQVDSGPIKSVTPTAGNFSTWSITVSIPTAGQHTLTARVTDKAGIKGANNIITITTT